jgi:signal peptidase I
MMKKNMPKDLNDTVLFGEEGEKSSGFSAILTWVLTVLLFFVLCYLGFVSFFGLCVVRQSSMTDTLADGDHVLIYKYPISVERGDIVILKGSEAGEGEPGYYPTLIKRVVATGGDTVKFVRGEHLGFQKYAVRLFIKIKGESEFKEANEPFIKEPMVYYEKSGSVYENVLDIEWIVPDKMLYVMGDNRNDSRDSRSFGPFPRGAVSGKVSTTVTPGSVGEKILLWIYRDPLGSN